MRLESSLVRIGLYSCVRHVVIPWAGSSLRLCIGCCVVQVFRGEQVVRGDAFTLFRCPLVVGDSRVSCSPCTSKGHQQCCLGLLRHQEFVLCQPQLTCGSRGEASSRAQGRFWVMCPCCVVQPAFMHHFFARTWAIRLPPCRVLLQPVLDFNTHYF